MILASRSTDRHNFISFYQTAFKIADDFSELARWARSLYKTRDRHDFLKNSIDQRNFGKDRQIITIYGKNLIDTLVRYFQKSIDRHEYCGNRSIDWRNVTLSY